ncbi:pentapeptide repeat-containing protein [Nocardia sp. NPDC058499]|uniref:pentapeptide repeat-containing protein n=1 Tax=Nocardia sp. NPDC058499 TaxID=3346530 RepID=UPI00365897C6
MWLRVRTGRAASTVRAPNQPRADGVGGAGSAIAPGSGAGLATSRDVPRAYAAPTCTGPICPEANLAAADLTHTDLRRALLIGADLTEAKLPPQ